MKLYIDTGIFIDYLARRGLEWSGLRASGRRGRDLAKVLDDSDQLLNRASGRHRLATSALTYYEVEEALYRRLAAAIKQVPKAKALVIPIARSMMLQTEMVIRLFGIEVLDLTASTVRGQLSELELQTRGVRAADALHLATAVAFDADVVVTADSVMLALDNILKGRSGQAIRCLDSDGALKLL